MKQLLLVIILLSSFLCLLFAAVTTPVISLGKNTKPLDSLNQLQVSVERLKKDVNTLCSTSKPRNYENTEALNEAAEYIKSEFTKAGFKPEEQKYMAEDNEYKNIIASIGPEDAPRLVIGAHYDVCEEQPGADDNASGVAGLLEIARLLNEKKPALKYRIDLVAYTLEEPPFFRTSEMGSAIHADYIVKNKIPFKGMICLEMIGYFTDKPKSQEYPIASLKAIYPSTGNFIAVVGKMGENSFTHDIKKNIIEGSSIKVESINAPKGLTGIDFSDHLNYWNHGLTAVMITNTSFYRNKNYHKPTDTPETLDYMKMAEVVKGVYHAVVNLK